MIDHVILADRVQRAMVDSAHKRVLVIEDDASIRHLLSANLSKQGMEPIEAPDGESGLQLAGEREPDVIVLDMRLPDIDGFTVLQRLKRTPATAATPVIAVTGDEGLLLGAHARVLALGAVGFLEKPFQMNDLLDEIRALTGEKERQHVDSHSGC